MVITGDLHSVLLNVWKRSIISTRQQTESLFTAGPLTHTQLHLCVRTLQLLSWILSSLIIFSPCGQGCPLLRDWVIWNWFCPLYTTPPLNTKHTVFVDMAYTPQTKKRGRNRVIKEERGRERTKDKAYVHLLLQHWRGRTIPEGMCAKQGGERERPHPFSVLQDLSF